VSELAAQDPVAIVGMAGVFPGAPDVETYWSNIVGRVDSISEMPAGRVDRDFYDPGSWATPAYDSVYAWRGGFVDDNATFDPIRFGVMPVAVGAIEPDQLLALRTAAAAIDDAGGMDRLPDRERVGVVLGRGGYIGPGMSRVSQRVRGARQVITILEQLFPGIEPEKLEEVRRAFNEGSGSDQPESAIGVVPNLTASRIANRLDLGGPAYTVDAACASSLLAVDQGIRDLSSGRCDVVLAGGVHHAHDVTLWAVFCQLRALSPSQQIRPFDRRADGLLIGEATGVVVLKRLEDARRAGDRIYAVILGTGVASDGRATSLMAPQSSGQALAVRQAWRAAGLDPTAPGAVGMLEAHGTGTPAGDAAELRTMRDVFGDDPGAGQIALGSVKSMIGHAMPAAGVAGVIKAAYALHHATLPPTLHCEEPHELLGASRLRLIDEPEPWDSSGPRRAGVNAFGFGGINAHVLMEEAETAESPRSPRRHRPASSRALSGARPADADAALDVMLRLAAETPAELGRLIAATAAGELSTGGVVGPGGPCRLAIVDPTPERLALAGKIIGRGRAWRGRNRVWFTTAPVLRPDAAQAGQVAFVFPGIERATGSGIEDVAGQLGLEQRPLERTGQPLVDQAVDILTTGQLLTAALARLRIEPSLAAGHSIGEWSAMLISEMVPEAALEDFVKTLGGQTLEIPGAVFAAFGCSAGRAKAAIAELADADRVRVTVSHDNCPEQSIVCGDQEVVARLVQRLGTQGVLGQVLPFRSGFHSPMLAPFMEPFRASIARVPLDAPKLPVWSATTLEPYPREPALVRALLVRHLLEAVRFTELVERLYATGVRAFIQMGPGSVVGFVDNTLRGRDIAAISAYPSGEVSGLSQLHRVAAALWVEGAEPDFGPLEADRAGSAPATAAAPGGAPIRLDLGFPLIRLGPDVQPLRLSRTADRGGTLETALPGGHALFAELDAVLREAADSSSAVLEALLTSSGPPPAAIPSQAPAPVVGPARGTGGASGTVAASGIGGTSDPAPTERTATLPVSVDAMPYLMDHGLFPQRPGWPVLSDWGPVVPMTTMVEMMLSEARQLCPGRVVTGIESIAALTWLSAIPSTSVSIKAVLDGPDRVKVSLVGHAYGTVLLGSRYPDARAPSSEPLAGETESDVSADRLYVDGWLFHGPSFQGITGLDAMAENGLRATITVPPAPGALLDNAGQAVGYWLGRNVDIAKLAFPRSIGRISFYGPPPGPGEKLECTVWAREVVERSIRADVELRTADGGVWAWIENWEDYRFGTDAASWPVIDKPAISCVGTEQPGDWLLVRGRWDPSLRQMMMRRYLTESERAEYDAMVPRAAGPWLLGRIAAKDAARRWLWARGAGPIFPAEVVVGNDPLGKPVVSGPRAEPIAVSLAHSGELAVAMIRSAAPGEWAPGIDIELVEDRGPAVESVAFAAGERELLDLVAADQDRSIWVVRFWAAKEAVSKALGTGLRGRPQDFVVAEVAADGLLRVEHGERAVRVATAVLDGSTHVVAWVVGPLVAREPGRLGQLELSRNDDDR
jgi:acyl transferase domain-containing protein/phosphopantetheinyl transferase